MNVRMVSSLDERYLHTTEKQPYLKSGFLDTGGTADYAAFVMARIDVRERIVYITGAKRWKVSEADNVFFATIRNDIAKLCSINKYDILGCETNNYGRSEMESMQREYGIRMIPVNTVGKLTNPSQIRKGESMDKEAIIKFCNSWRHNAMADPSNSERLGQIKFPKQKTETLSKLTGELDNFVRIVPDAVGSTGRPKFGAEGSGHDDLVMAMLGNLHLIKTRIFRVFSGQPAIGAARHDNSHVVPSALPVGRAIRKVHDNFSAF